MAAIESSGHGIQTTHEEPPVSKRPGWVVLDSKGISADTSPDTGPATRAKTHYAAMVAFGEHVNT